MGKGWGVPSSVSITGVQHQKQIATQISRGSWIYRLIEILLPKQRFRRFNGPLALISSITGIEQGRKKKWKEGTGP